MHIALTRQDHRPWPIPEASWRWCQTWHDLLFIHWPVLPSRLRPHVPDELSLDVRDGVAWIGLVPFRMTGLTLRGIPELPWLSAFPEMNLRTYASLDGKPGVWFLRMDAARGLAVAFARLALGLPYVWSRMVLVRSGETVGFFSENGTTRFRARYAPLGAAREPVAGSLEAFLTERYCLYSTVGGMLVRMEIHHRPWSLQPAGAVIQDNTIAESLALPPTPNDPVLHFAAQQEVVGWGPEILKHSAGRAIEERAGKHAAI